MAVWLVRAGRHGEHEARFFNDNRIYLTWSAFAGELEGLADRKKVREAVEQLFPGLPVGKVSNWTGQIHAFLNTMKTGDLVVLPRKSKATIAIAVIQGGVQYDPAANERYRYFRRVTWNTLDVPRSAFDRELLASFSAMQTISQITKPDVESRVQAAAKGTAPTSTSPSLEISEAVAEQQQLDLERLGRDQIARKVIERFKGHEMAVLVDAILKAQGYTTFLSPPGPDKGIDILAAPGPLGFGRPRICAQVKSQESPVDTPTLNQLIGAMQNVNADQGLLVAWGGFKTSVDREAPAQFFRVRLWDQEDLIDQILEHYDTLSDDLRAELPLKRIWTVASQDTDE